MRLIDADAFKEYAKERLDICADDLIAMIDEQPTVYDVEAVVKRLKELYDYNSEQADIYRDAEESDRYFRDAIERYMDRANCYGVAIRTVRNGGKD